MDEWVAGDGLSPSMTVGIRGVLREYPWVGQAGLEHDLDEDVFSLAVKRATAYGWSSTRLGAGAELGGQRWGHADAGGDWAQDGACRRLAWLTVYPATALNEQHLPVVPMVRVLSDVLGRVGEWDFAGLTLSVPVGLAPDARFDLLGDADWYALAAPDATAEVTVNVTVQVVLDATELVELMTQRSRRLLRITSTAAKGGGITLECHAPEWSPDAAAWIAEVLVDSLRAAGVRGRAEVAVSETGTSGGEAEGAWS